MSKKEIKTSQKKCRWLRWVIRGILGLLALIIIAVIAAYYYLGALVKEAVTRFVPPMTGTTATVEQVDLSLLSGVVEIRDLKIGNPKGYSDQNLFELGTIRIVFVPKSVLTDRIQVTSVLVSGTKVSAELKNLYSLDSNVGTVQKNVESYLGTGKKKSTPAQTTKTDTSSKSAGKKVVIKDLQIRDTELTLGAGGHTITLPLPDIRQQDIGADKKGKSIGDVIASILDSISLESVQAIANSAKDLAKKGLKGASDLVNAGTDAVTNTAKSTVNGLKNLFK